MKKILAILSLAALCACQAELPPADDPGVEARATEILMTTGIQPADASKEEWAFALRQAQAELQAERQEDLDSGITGVLNAIPGGLGGVLSSAYGLYLLARPRSRKHLAGAAVNLKNLNLGGALKSIDKAIGGAHTEPAPPQG